ncbi:hypothetical protein GC197_09290 [bacterium]|nr:hypothetical protein [bacterium]
MPPHIESNDRIAQTPSVEFPIEIRRDPTGSGGTRFALPLRPATVRREGRFLQVVALLLMLIFPGAAIATGIVTLVNGPPGTEWFGIGFIVFSLFFAYFIAALFLAGSMMHAGCCEITIENGRLRTTEQIGFIRLSQTGLLEQVERLVIEPCEMTSKGRPGREGAWTELAGLRVELDDSSSTKGNRRKFSLSSNGLTIENNCSPIQAAVAYPRSWIQALAAELQPLCGSGQMNAGARDGVPIEETQQDTPEHFVQREITVQPATSSIQVEPIQGGVSLLIPAVGLLKKSNVQFLFWFGLVWFGIALMPPVAWLLLVMLGAALPADMTIRFAVGTVLALGVGAASLLGGISMARCRVAIAVADGRLMIARFGLFGRKRAEWSRDEISTIGIGYSGLKIQGVPAMQLLVQSKDGTKFRALTGRDRTELDWIATTLRRELQVAPPSEVDLGRPCGRLGSHW